MPASTSAPSPVTVSSSDVPPTKTLRSKPGAYPKITHVGHPPAGGDKGHRRGEHGRCPQCRQRGAPGASIKLFEQTFGGLERPAIPPLRLQMLADFGEPIGGAARAAFARRFHDRSGAFGEFGFRADARDRVSWRA